MKQVILIPLILMSTGCKLFDGFGGDSSEAIVERSEKCKFDLRQAARVSGIDNSDVVENVTVTPDCDVKIEFRQVVGEGVVEIEDRGGMEVLEHAAPKPSEGEPE